MSQQLALPSIEGSTKRCAACGIVKPWRMFYMRTRNGTTRPISRCRKCSVRRVLKWKREQPEAYTAHKRDRATIRRSAKIAALGAPVRCEICGHKFDGTGRWGPQYDHHHGTGEARGWLCNGCNRALGWLGDNPAIVQSALNYLRRHGFSLKRPRIS